MTNRLKKKKKNLNTLNVCVLVFATGSDAEFLLAGCTGDPGLSAEEGHSVHYRNADISPLEGGGQAVRPVVPVSS